MSRSTVGQRVVGSIAGLLVGGLGAGGLSLALFYSPHSEDDFSLLFFVFYGGLGFLLGGTLGAAVGAWIGQMRSFGESLLGAVVGLLIGVVCALTGFGIPFVPVVIVAGAVIGSGKKGKTVSSSGTQGVTAPSNTPAEQPGQAKCPFCHSATFHVEEEAGSRRCSDCHSVLPSYIEGNR